MRRLGRLGRAVAAGGPTVAPSWIAVGTGDNRTTANPTPAYGTNVAGDLFIMQGLAQSGNLATPAGWTLITSVAVASNTEYAWYRTARSTGGESGTVSINSVSNTFSQAQIFTFRGVATSSFVEGAATSSNAGSTCPGPSVTCGGNARLAVLLVSSNNGNAGMASSTGETGGDWAEATAEWTSGLGPGIQLQTAAMLSGGTISGGSSNVNGTAACGIGFALVGL